jgi:hypothetical protein
MKIQGQKRLLSETLDRLCRGLLALEERDKDRTMKERSEQIDQVGIGASDLQVVQ